MAGLVNKVVLVTGCSSGIGLATAVACLKRGARVFAGVRRPHDQSSALTAAAAAAGVSTDRLRIVQLDVTSDESVASAVEEVAAGSAAGSQGQRRIDALVNSAGGGVNGTLEIVSVKAAQELFDANVWGVYRMVQAVAPVMRAQGDGGHVVNISSASAFRRCDVDVVRGGRDGLCLDGKALES
jgi:NAD(P)-dependent dehydrogenase (short-subunit alcohol dehydrogenase family)